MDVCHFYISHLSFDVPERKKLVNRIDECLAKNSVYRIFEFLSCLLNFAVFSLIFNAGKKINSALDKVIPCQDFLFSPDF